MSEKANARDALMVTSKRFPAAMVEGHGSYLFDENGKRYLDFVQGWAVNCLGHSPAVVADAVSAQSRKLVHCGPVFYTPPLLELASLIVGRCCLDRVFFTNCGAEANEGAIKLARKWGQKNKAGAFEIVTTENSFHGRTLATMSASGKPGWDRLFEPKVPGFVKVPLNDLDAARRAIGERTAAFMIEPVQGEGGVNLASVEYMRGLRDLTRDKGALLVLDEVQTGMGRTGKLFAYEHFGIEPDVMTLGKGIAGGAPLGALVAREDVCCFEPGEQGGTFNGGALMTAIGAAVFKAVSDPAFLVRAAETGAYLASELSALAERRGERGVRGRGLLLALVLSAPRAADVVERAFEAGLLLNAPRPDILRFMPALNVSRAEVDAMIAMLDDLLASEGDARGLPTTGAQRMLAG
jgi:acetylornithine/N-succinyldiaminopimelate aminotransferase